MIHPFPGKFINGLMGTVYFAHDYDEGKTPSIIKNLTPDVYLTIDVDVFDPSVIPATGTPEQFAAFFTAETRKWAGIVAAAHIGAE